jgi:hypothetical protein
MSRRHLADVINMLRTVVAGEAPVLDFCVTYEHLWGYAHYRDANQVRDAARKALEAITACDAGNAMRR